MLRTTIAQGPAPTVFLAGEMDLDCADTLREAVAEAARGAQMVILDFANVEFIDSSGTGIFVRLCLDMKSQGTPFMARRLPPAVRGVFDMLRVRDLVGDEVFCGEVAQLVEHATENRGVGSSSLPLGTTTLDAVIERKWLSW